MVGYTVAALLYWLGAKKGDFVDEVGGPQGCVQDDKWHTRVRDRLEASWAYRWDAALWRESPR